MKRLLFISVICFMLGLTPAWAQYKTEKEATIPLEYFYIQRQGNGFLRNLLSKVHWSVSTGYGNTAFKHKLDGFGIAQDADSLVKIFDSGNPTVHYGKWVNDVAPAAPYTGSGFRVSSDTASIGFRSRTFSIPLKATAHVEFNRYRIGGGYSIEYTRIGSFQPTSFTNSIEPFSLEKQTIFMKHYFGMIGASVYRYYEYNLAVEANIGGYSMGRSFNKSLMRRGVYFNLGALIERDMSEYFRIFVRPSYEIKGYRLTIPETGDQINHRLNAFYINVGVTYRLPELRRCFLKSCHAQLNHVHGNREYRSRRHPIYKKQNPHYGENYPNLIKYKGKNKRKLNPY